MERCSPIRIESLEDRCTPAGTVNVAAVLSGIRIIGDAAANSIRIGPGAAAGSIKVKATDADTTITGTPELDATNQKVNVVLGAGNDHLEITGGLNLQQIVVNLGTGNNEFSTSGPFAVAGDMKVFQAGTAGITSTATINFGPGRPTAFRSAALSVTRAPASWMIDQRGLTDLSESNHRLVFGIDGRR